MQTSLVWKIGFAATLFGFLFFGFGSDTSGQFMPHHDKGGKDSDKGGKDSGKGFDHGSVERGGKNDGRNEKPSFDSKGSGDARNDKGSGPGGWRPFGGPPGGGSMPHPAGPQDGNFGGSPGRGLPPGGFGSGNSGVFPNSGNHPSNPKENPAGNRSKNNPGKAKPEHPDKPPPNKNKEEGKKLNEEREQRLREIKEKHDQNLHHFKEIRDKNAQELAQIRYEAFMRNYRGVLLPQIGDGSYLTSATSENANQLGDDDEDKRREKETDEERAREREESKARDDKERDLPRGNALPPQRRNFVVVTLAGLRVNHETKDDPLDRDGEADEVFIRCWAIVFDRLTGRFRIEADAKTKVLGDVSRAADRIKGGSASPSGGLHSGDTVPDVGLFGPGVGLAGADGLPLHVYTGLLTDNELLLIVPVIFEWDDNAESPGTNRSALLDAFIRLHREEILSSLEVVDSNKVLTAPGPAIGFPLVHGDSGGNRPVGMSRLPNFEKSVFSPYVLLFNRTTAERCAKLVFPEPFGDKGRRLPPLPPGIVPLRYADEESLGTGGDYTLFVQIRD